MALMRKLRRVATVVAVAVAVAALVASTPPAVVGTISPTAAAWPVQTVDQRVGVRWLTLVTGDRVAFGAVDGEVVHFRPGQGRAGVGFVRRVEGGDTYVFPTDALSLVAAGRVDRRLFNVSLLARCGYDDTGRKDLPLILTHESGASVAAVQVGRALVSVDGAAVGVPKARAGQFWDSVTGTAPQALAAGVTKVWLDGPVTASLDRSVPQVGAPAAWQAGLTGNGATVAVLDTGIDATHPDLADAVVGAQDFTGSQSGTADRDGHGTHVAGIITGDGAASGGALRGVAPEAKLLNGKVLNDFGVGLESWIIAGMEWAAAQDADVVNMSLGAWDLPGVDPMEHAVNRLTAQTGTLFVIAAGNSGPVRQSISSPGSADAALTVGAVDKQDGLAQFSSRGPRAGDLAIKPDITAPGVDIVSARAAGTEGGPPVGDHYVRASGTSMAAPHVAGAAAILAAQHAGWDADQLKPTLMGSATPRDGLSVHDQGAGRLDVAHAVAQHVHATPASISHGLARWPHHDDQPIVTTLTYHNTSAEPVTLDLTVQVRDPDGNPAPAGMFTADQPSVTIPAGDTASVQLTTNTAVPAPDGAYEGHLVATGGPVAVRTPITVTREVESYDVRLTMLDRNGQPASDYSVRFTSIDRGNTLWAPYDPSGTVVVRVPRGTYLFEAEILMGTWESPGPRTLMPEPNLTVDADANLVMDAREGRPTGVVLDKPDADSAWMAVEFLRQAPWGPAGSLNGGDPDLMYVRPSATTAPQFTYSVQVWAARPDGKGSYDGTPYIYNVQWSHDDRVPTDLVRRIRDRELATQQTRIAASAPDQWVAKELIIDMRTPTTLVERFTPGVAWQPAYFLLDGPLSDDSTQQLVALYSAPVTYQRGEHRAQRWNVGPFGPCLPEASRPWVGRSGDTIAYNLQQMFCDQPPTHWGTTDPLHVSTTLLRNGEPVGSSIAMGEFEVPAGEATYRLEASLTHTFATLSTTVTAAWTFRSGQVPSDKPRALPVAAVRFAPDLDEHNQAKAGRRFTIPVYVQQQHGATHGTLPDLTVQVSYDDGRTWHPARLTGSGPHRTVTLQHPPDARFVSLKASATDSHGNALEQTIIRAYALTP